MREFHVRREPRERYAVERPLIGTRGDLVVADTAGMRRLAARMNVARSPGDPSIQAGEIGALGLLHELGHLLIERYEADRRPGAMAAALEKLKTTLGRDAGRLLDRFGHEFPGPGTSLEPPAHRLEELLLTRISNENPAVGPLHELIDDRALAEGTRYHEAIAGLEEAFEEGPPVGSGGLSLIEMMRAPARHAPTSLAGQLRYIRSAWRDLLGAGLDDLIHRLDVTIGILAEEDRALHVRFGMDAACRPDGEEHLRLARPAVAPVRARDPDARCDPRRGARYARALGDHRTLAHRPVGAVEGIGEDQADARQS